MDNVIGVFFKRVTFLFFRFDVLKVILNIIIYVTDYSHTESF